MYCNDIGIEMEGGTCMSGISGINSAYSYNSVYGQIASGNKLTSAAKGPAEMAIVQEHESQIRGTNAATNNLKSGKDVLNISDAALGGITDYLQRIRELAVQAGNTATVSDSDRRNIQKEIDQMKQGIQDIASQTQYNTKNLLDGSFQNGFKITSDANGSSVTIQNSANSTLDALGIADFDVTKKFDLRTIDNALNKVNSNRSQGGAQSNRLDYAIHFNAYASYNTTAAKSRLADTDYPQAISEMKKQQTLQTYSFMMQKRKMQDQARMMQNFWT